VHDDVKAYRRYDEQVELLVQRGMHIADREAAAEVLRRVNYYRLCGYWYPFRRQAGPGRRDDDFYPGTRLDDVVALYEFDARLRAATFSVLAPVELAVRALLGHELGRVDPCAPLDHTVLGPTARVGGRESDSYRRWRDSYERELAQSREDFVEHHRARYGSRLPVWAAVELLDWGGLTYLYSYAPRAVQDAVADRCGLRGPQLTSWLKVLDLVRNTCAHHGRLFNRVHTLTPRLPPVGMHPDLDAATKEWNRTFGQLTLVQFLLDRLALGRSSLLPAVIRSYPEITRVPWSHLGAGSEWSTTSRLWRTSSST
jgi:abortive infection bacteriophage resistance protein